MNKISRPEWDKVNEHHAISSKSFPISSVHAPGKVGMRVSAHYKGEFVGLVINKALSETEFIANITSFSPPAEHYEDLSINQQVLIDRKDEPLAKAYARF